jgi:predicted Zn finger-like uncharacterized protein
MTARDDESTLADDGLEPLITECPGCHTRFRVLESQLQTARGRVRCGACLTVFNGVEHLDWVSAQAFADEQQAERAMDALLDELAGDRPDEPARTSRSGVMSRPNCPSRPGPLSQCRSPSQRPSRGQPRPRGHRR